MLHVPKSVVSRWTPYGTHWTGAAALVHACIDGAPGVTGCGLDLERIDVVGWRSAVARRLYGDACERIAQKCVTDGRYAHNVAVLQELDGHDDSLRLSTTTDRRTLERAPNARWPFRRLREKTRQLESRQACARYRQLPNWSTCAAGLRHGDAVLVAAPLCADPGDDERDRPFHLCDYPDFVRAAADPKVALDLSAEAVQFLHEQLGGAAAWHPFARVLGLVRATPSGLHLVPLRLELRVPVAQARRYDFYPTWDEALVAEAAAPTPALRETAWAEKHLPTLRRAVSIRLPGDVAESPAHAELARRRALAADHDSYRSLTRGAGTPYEGVDAFWCAAAALLPPWKREFPLESAQVDALLMAFDAAHGPSWQAIAGDPAAEGALRYTPAVMAEARSRLAALR